MLTNVKATNWPTRDEARLNTPRASRKGHKVASRRTYETRRVAAVAKSMDALLERAQKHFARAAAIDAAK